MAAISTIFAVVQSYAKLCTLGFAKLMVILTERSTSVTEILERMRQPKLVEKQDKDHATDVHMDKCREVSLF